ncbi:hypothetical protein PM3016_163 [Paenibacillus mucilaginosus 3016]|uniref:Lipoprotein n=1 Tax=Paenibacillus mucilaginosus 3016 TaxID=1116391 RepID=H6NTJ8_9BACL|nr:hypothetical protein [Paenibacillus mucilaginosus]AFC27145.1 hypothetical protein PM3016_163 [Paenibacillus mucilaginosus 3016]WFA16074.1 hypothetical protein ERY13_00820 [Paenibacillus mucilaginosus]
MKRLLMLGMLAALVAGCQTTGDGSNDANMKTLQKTVGRERLLQTFSQVTPPPTGKEVLSGTDEQVITWIRQVDDWTHKVLSSPVTGEMDEYAMREMRKHLTQVYTPQMSQQLIDYFYRHDPTVGTYQANSTKAMLELRSEWDRYELRKEQPAKNQYKLTLTGRRRGDGAESVMNHSSAYQIQGDRLVITDFRTESGSPR